MVAVSLTQGHSHPSPSAAPRRPAHSNTYPVSHRAPAPPRPLPSPTIHTVCFVGAAPYVAATASPAAAVAPGRLVRLACLAARARGRPGGGDARGESEEDSPSPPAAPRASLTCGEYKQTLLRAVRGRSGGAGQPRLAACSSAVIESPRSAPRGPPPGPAPPRRRITVPPPEAKRRLRMLRGVTAAPLLQAAWPGSRQQQGRLAGGRRPRQAAGSQCSVT